jgi:hypothetical protein
MCQSFKSHDEVNNSLKLLLETDNLDIQLGRIFFFYLIINYYLLISYNFLYLLLFI